MSDFEFGQILPRPTGLPYDKDHKYLVMETCYDDYQSEWLSLTDNNKGNALPGYDEDFMALEDDNWRCIVNVRIAYEKGEDARLKGNTAELQGKEAELKGNTSKEKGDQAEVKGLDAAFFARAAKLMAENPPKVGRTLPGHAADDNNWWYFMPNADYTGGTYVDTGVYAKGDDLDYESLTPEQKQEIANAIIAMLMEVSDEDAHAIWNDFVFETTD